MTLARFIASACTTATLAAVLTGLMATLPAAAQTQWKWRAADGRVQYSDRPPPPEVAESSILARPAGATRRFNVQDAILEATTAQAASAPAPKAVDPQLEAKKKQAEQAEKNKNKAEEERVAKQRAENCARARSYAKSLEDGNRIARPNAKGENEILDDAQRAQELARTRQIASSDCS